MSCSLYVAKIALQQAKRANQQVHPIINLSSKGVSPVAIDGGEGNSMTPTNSNGGAAKDLCASKRMPNTIPNTANQHGCISSPTTSESTIAIPQGLNTNQTSPESRHSRTRSPFRNFVINENVKTRPKSLSIPINSTTCNFLQETQRVNPFLKKTKKKAKSKEDEENK